VDYVKSLTTLINGLAKAAPADRIELREPILAYGVAAVAPLADLAAANPDLGPAVTAWLEVLARRDEEARPEVVAALRVLVATSGEETKRHATDALGRLGVTVSAPRARRTPVAKA
jgi:hypothetical protein